MPNFETHFWLGKKVGVVCGILSGAVMAIITFDPAWTLLGLFLGYYSAVIGSVAPDIDLSQPSNTLKYASKPYRKLVLLINLIIVVALCLGLSLYNRGGLDLTQAVVSITAIASVIALIRVIPDILHNLMPKHRGMTHQLSFWVIMSAVSGYLIHRLLLSFKFSDPASNVIPAVLGVGVLMGIFTHISSDTISTVVRKYAPERLQSHLPWVPKRLPILLDIPRLLKVGIDGRAPLSVRFLVVFTIIYGLVPVDLISDLIPVIGWTDDFSVYLYLRRTVYQSYEQNTGIIDSIKRDYVLLDRVVLPALFLGALAFILLIWYLF
jgi:uncharacterized membrane protein YkvA (DUF1232 family)